MCDRTDILKRAFTVDDYPKDFDPTAEPRDGYQYLQQVRWEASNCEDVVTAVIDKKKLKNTTVVSVLPTCEKVPSEFLPDKEWELIQVAKFSKMRQRVGRFRKLNHLQLSFTANRSDVLIPNIDDEEKWRSACMENAIQPLLSIMLRMPQALIERLLQFNAEWLTEIERLSVSQGRWIYALMACLELPLSPESCSSLRALARECARIRVKEVNNVVEPIVTPLNMIICLVAHYFSQTDLADTSN